MSSIYPRQQQSQGFGFHLCLSVCLSLSVFFLHEISKTGAARITKLNVPRSMSPEKSFILGQRSRVTKPMPAWVFALLWVLASASYWRLLFWRVTTWSCCVVEHQEDLMMLWITSLKWVVSRMFHLSLHLEDVPSAVCVPNWFQLALSEYFAMKAPRSVQWLFSICTFIKVHDRHMVL